MEKVILIGHGEIGKGIRGFYGKYHNIDVYDLNYQKDKYEKEYDLMLVAIPYNEKFVEAVKEYQKIFKPKATIIFSTVAIGTTVQIENAVHVPIEGKHPHLEESIARWQVFIGGENKIATDFFMNANKMIYQLEKPEHTEFMKLQSTSNYGLMIEYARYVNSVCKDIGLDYSAIKLFNMAYNNLYKVMGMPNYKRYVLDAPEDEGISGHCVLENALTLYQSHPSMLLEGVMSLGKHKQTIKEDKLYKNKTWLACEYYGKGKTMSQIGSENNCTGENIARYMNKFKFRKRTLRWTPEQEQKLRELSETKTFVEIAPIIGKTYDAVRNHAIILGLESCYDPSVRDYKTRKKISCTLQGIEEKEWEDFSENINSLIRKSEAYKKWRLDVFIRDNFKCQNCNKETDLNAHHIKPFSKYPELRLEISNGITLCRDCHVEVHRDKEAN